MKSVFTLGNNCITIGLVDIRYPVVRLLLLKNPILSSSFLFAIFAHNAHAHWGKKLIDFFSNTI